MTFQVSPGVQFLEIDATNIVPSVSTSIGGTVGAFRWGPVEDIKLLSSEKDLGTIFGTPNKHTYTRRSFLTASSFFKFSGSLKVVRTIANSVAVVNAFSSEAVDGVLVKNEDDYEQKAENFTASTPNFLAKYPGELGNSLGLAIATDQTSFDDAGFAEYKGLFDTAPGTSLYAEAKGSAADEMHIVVIDTLGKWTGTAGSVLESFAYVSQAVDAKAGDGSSAYIRNVINNTSDYIWIGSDIPALSDIGTLAEDTASYTVSATPLIVTLSGGTIDDSINDLDIGDISTGLTVLSDSETVDVNLLFVPALDAVSDVDLANNMIAFAEARKDVLACISPDITRTSQTSDALTDVLDWANAVQSSSYATMDSTAVKVYDKYNDEYVWVPACGQVAGLCAAVPNVWESPAGYNKGQLRSVSRVAFNPNQAQRDELYKARVNPIVSFPGEGTILYGDKTALSRPSAFDRINVRRLFMLLEKSISISSKFLLFELNDEFTRAAFRNSVEPYLRNIKGLRGLNDFHVVCDTTNNTGEVIDRNEFVASIYIKPPRSINFITLSFIATRTGVEFSEIIGL